jgi:hypothetical protein
MRTGAWERSKKAAAKKCLATAFQAFTAFKSF